MHFQGSTYLSLLDKKKYVKSFPHWASGPIGIPSIASTAVGQTVACAPVTQGVRVRSPVGTSFLGEVFLGFSSPVRQMSGSFRAPRSPNIIWPSLSSQVIIIIHYGRQWPEMLTRPITLNIHTILLETYLAIFVYKKGAVKYWPLNITIILDFTEKCIEITQFWSCNFCALIANWLAKMEKLFDGPLEPTPPWLFRNEI